MDTYNMFYENEFILYEKLIEYLEKDKDDWKIDKIFIADDMDKHQSPFAWMSYNNDIGVVAKSELAGYILLFLLQIVIEEDPCCLLEVYIDDDDPKNYINSIDCLIKKIQTIQLLLIFPVSIYQLHEKIPIKGLRDEIMYHKELKFVDIWNIKRIKTAINELNKSIIDS